MRPSIPAAGSVLATGAATMALEVLLPRRLAPQLGSSLPVWTASIAVVLLGLAVGSTVGGRLADLRRGRVLEPWVLLLAAAALALAPTFGSAAAGAAASLPLVPRALLGTGAAALPATLLLGAVYPVAARSALAGAPSPARTLGILAAASAAGSLAGTFATSYVLIPTMPVPSGFAVAAGLLAVVAALRAGARSGSGDAGAAPPPAPSPDGSRVPPFASLLALAALAGAVTLGLEVVAARRTAIHAGSSLEAWTSVLAVVLGGLTVGGLAGGRLASARAPRAALAWTLLVAAALVAAAPWTARAIPYALALEGSSFPFRVAMGVALAYGPAFTALGAIPPVLARSSLAGDASAGGRVGAISASGTAGALLGALVTGPWVLPALRIEGAAEALATLLALAALATGTRRRVAVPVAVAAGLLAVAARADVGVARLAGLALGLRPDADGVWVRDGGYARVLVDEAPEAARYGRPRVVRLRIDARTHGVHDLDDPSWIGSNYGTLYAAATARVAAAARAPRALFLGGGTYTAPRSVLAWRPEATADVAEIDPDVTRAAREVLGLRTGPRLRVAHEDARAFVRGLPAGSPPYDLVYADAFGDMAVPWQLTTVEFAREVKARMTPDGVYFANTIDMFDSGRFVAAMRATLRAVFRHVETIGARRGDDWPQNFVFVASDAPVDLEDLRRADPAARGPEDPGLPVVRYTDAEMDALAARVGARVLTDDFAPVEDLLAPVVRLVGGAR